MTSRCVMVLGIPRSGTSATAGVLHHAGVLMERVSMGRNVINPRGYYEDVQWKRANARWAGRRYRLIVPATVPPAGMARYRVLATQYQTAPLWGMKDPRLCVMARYIWPLLDDVRIVAVRRDLDASVRSIMSQSRILKQPLSEDAAMQLLIRWVELMNDTLAAWPGPLCEVGYEALVADPIGVTGRLCAFASEGTGLELDTARGAAFIDPHLDHGGDHPRAR